MQVVMNLFPISWPEQPLRGDKDAKALIACGLLDQRAY
jgi:hypothetical protein